MDKLLIICGPTATGKTSLAVKLAKKFNGELISADSRQVYKGMDIGTGKDKPKKIKIHLIDVVNPNQEFSLSHFYPLAWQKIKSLWRKGKLPILVGGTGFYIKGIVDGVATRDIPRNPKIRAELEGWSAEKLFEYLAQIDSERGGSMNRSDKKNPRRLVRAIEVAIYRKENPSWCPPDHEETNHLFIGLKASLEILDKKIDLRVKERLEQGLEKEIKKLLAKGYNWDKSALGETLAYQEWEPFFKGKQSKKEIINRWKIDEHQYARKQMTWFKKNKGINWFDINKKGWENRVEDLIRKWYSKNNAQ